MVCLIFVKIKMIVFEANMCAQFQVKMGEPVVGMINDG